MAKSKFLRHLKILVLALFSLILTLIWPTIVVSQSPLIHLNQIQFTPPEESAPALARRQESRSRCPCYNSINSLTALLPPTSLALTTADRPTFFLYVPHATAKSVDKKDNYGCNKTVTNMNLRESFEVEFELVDERENKLYQTVFTIAGTPGIISFTLPKNAPTLELNKYYKWYFEIICDREDRSGDSVVSGWTRRVEINPTLAKDLANAAPINRPAIYAQSGLWHDTITSLAELRKSNPQDSHLANAWAELLNSVGLEKISQEPLINCCTT
ncbi:hypothetical protein BCD67_11855 [Oscillatoriales cyanobacterium USR001]|nr:hypothetical protein BCD67_11855 [Oscillatoriales cyanobacterium USR001]